jgi:hypothetical protein
MKNYLIIGVLFAALAGCSGGGSGSAGSASSASSLNPFGKLKSRKDAIEVPLEYRDPRAFIPEILSLRGEPAKGGVLVRATGRIDMAGYHTVTLVVLNNGFPDADGNLMFEFRGFLPDPKPTVQSTDKIEAAVFISSAQLRSIRSIRVQAQENSMTINR